MRKLMLLLCAWLCVLALVVPLTSAYAVTPQARTWVSNSGTDADNCVLAAPCATFAYALTVTVPGGEIDCLTPGNYGSEFTITQSVTIDCGDGQVGAITAGGFTVASGAGSVVIIRNLTINAAAASGSSFFGTVGIGVDSVGALVVENCHIVGFPIAPALGIDFAPTSASGATQLSIANTFITNNGNSIDSLSGGIYIKPASGATATVSIDHSQINGNYFGIVADGRSGGTISATISDSVVADSAENGITAISSGSAVVFMIDQTKVTGNAAAGLFAGGSGAGMLVRNTTVFRNGNGLDSANNAVLFSYGNNSVAGNATNGAFTGTISQQ